MTRKEFLFKKFTAYRNDYEERHKEFYSNPSVAQIDPFKIADGLYYVGDKNVCIHLIDTGDGLVLIDSGFFGATHLLVDSIWRLGFDPRNIRMIIHTHRHNDHFGSSDEFRRMYGAKLAISRVDAQLLRKKPAKAPKSFPLAKIPAFDYEIEDGEILEFGRMKIRCVLTPGHTEGVLSLFFNVTDNGKEYLAGLFGGAGIASIRYQSLYCNESSMDLPYQMKNSINKVLKEPVVVHLGNHPANNRTLEKREQQLREGGNPFIAPDSWHNFLNELLLKVDTVINDNKVFKEELDRLFGRE